ncbi:MAG: hypothetical protein JWQ81_3628 [Amycolatopsis sp.]|jgi:hypothetical protein|uniref:SRPBCC family protein n=1 Tax=Amycolatopsis sp. TaxID=37632 RepID=UPI002632EED8|nr:SRPBCC family protein [Amycolatopsis sp.]MCU1682889.1 hypothetical protein [Amycolatopsis sp.]
MVDVVRTFTVPEPVDVIVAYLKDFANAENWNPGTVSCSRVDNGPIEVGSKWHHVSEFHGRTIELAYHLARYEPRHLTFLGENETETSTEDLKFVPVAEGTSITYHANLVFDEVGRLADSLLKHEFDKFGDEVVATMTRTLSSQPKTSGLP